MKSLDEFLSKQSEITIQTLASYIREYAHEQWRQVLQQRQQELLRLFEQAGEAAYGVYGRSLWRPVYEQLKLAGFLTVPSFPGTLSTSLEWGPLQERERWMWCVVRPAQGAVLGTIVVTQPHDHTRFRIPRSPNVHAFEETDADAIVQLVSRAAGYPRNQEE